MNNGKHSQAYTSERNHAKGNDESSSCAHFRLRWLRPEAAATRLWASMLAKCRCDTP